MISPPSGGLPVALQVVEERRRHLLVAATEIAREPDFPAGASHKSRLDEIVAHDLAAERRPAGKTVESAILDERLDPENRVVAPIGAFAELPVMESRRKHRAIDASSELLRAGVERFVIHGHRNRLDDARARAAFHKSYEAHDGLTSHQAVGIENDHVIVVCARSEAHTSDL